MILLDNQVFLHVTSSRGEWHRSAVGPFSPRRLEPPERVEFRGHFRSGWRFSTSEPARLRSGGSCEGTVEEMWIWEDYISKSGEFKSWFEEVSTLEHQNTPNAESGDCFLVGEYTPVTPPVW